MQAARRECLIYLREYVFNQNNENAILYIQMLSEIIGVQQMVFLYLIEDAIYNENFAVALEHIDYLIDRCAGI